MNLSVVCSLFRLYTYTVAICLCHSTVSSHSHSPPKDPAAGDVRRDSLDQQAASGTPLSVAEQGNSSVDGTGRGSGEK